MTRLLPILLLTACGSVPVEHFEDSRVIGIEPGTYTVTTTVVVDVAEQVREWCERWMDPGEHGLGCAVELPGNPHRMVIIPLLRDANDSRVLEITGHECLHGWFGDWHR